MTDTLCHTNFKSHRHTMPTIRQRGAKWQAIIRIKQNGTIVHQETRTFDTERLAKDWAQRVEQRIRKEGTPSRKLELETLGGLLEKYQERLSGVRPLRRTAASELDLLTTHFRSAKLSLLTSETFTRFAKARKAEGAGPVTILHNLSTIRSALNAARPMFALDINGEVVNEAVAALARTGEVAKSRSRTRRVSDDEINQMVKEYERAAHYPSTLLPMATIVRLAVALPRRRSELCTMRWEDYDRKAGTLTLRDTKHPRNPRTEVIPVPPAAQAIIKSLPVIDERILPYEAESVSASFERMCKRLGLQDLRLHDLRHEGISRLFELGLEIQEVALISGHTSWSTLRRYTHLKPASVLEKLNARSQKTQEAPAQPAGAGTTDGGDAHRPDTELQGAHAGGSATPAG